jgi:hypothetical protein
MTISFRLLAGYTSRVKEGLLEGWRVEVPARGRMASAIGHALRFETWRSLAGAEAQGDEGAADLMVSLAQAVAAAGQTVEKAHSVGGTRG